MAAVSLNRMVLAREVHVPREVSTEVPSKLFEAYKPGAITLSPWSLSHTCEAGGAPSSPVSKTRGSWMASQSSRGSSTRDVVAAKMEGACSGGSEERHVR